MIPASFAYRRAASVDEAIELVGADEDAKLLAGGHSLIPAMKLRIARPSTLVDIGRLEELRYVREDGDLLDAGANRHHDGEALGEVGLYLNAFDGRSGKAGQFGLQLIIITHWNSGKTETSGLVTDLFEADSFFEVR